MIQDAGHRMPHTEVMVFPPEGAPEAGAMLVRTQRPKMTRRAASLLLAFDRYVRMSFTAGGAVDETFSLMEAQKVVYFLQQAGGRTSFRFAAGTYGPCAHAVDQWLSDVEGHYVVGYGDGTSGSQAVLRLDRAAVDEAEHEMRADVEFTRDHLVSVGAFATEVRSS